MTQNRSPLPPELADALRDDPHAADLARVWTLLDAAAPPEMPPPTEADWQRLRAATVERVPQTSDAPSNALNRAADRPARRRSDAYRRRTRLGWLAVCVAAIAFGGLLWLSTPVTVTAPAGTMVNVTLPDGSSVELNSGTVLTYPRGFVRLPLVSAEERAVRLTGEAFFDVQSGERPFVVHTSDARVRVLGTAFNVRARAQTFVTVEEGRVRVEGLDGEGNVVLTAGERARVSAGAASRVTSGVTHALVWRSRGFAAQEQPLADILAELERRYDVDIELSADGAADDTLTLYFPRATEVESILRDVCTARGLQYRRTSRGFDVY